MNGNSSNLIFMVKQFVALILFELKLICLTPDNIWGGVLYFLLSLIIMPFTLDIFVQDISLLAPTMIWVAIIPAILISSNRVFIADFEDGFLDRYLLMNITFELVFFIKICVIYLSIVMPLLIVLPMCAFLFSLSFDILLRLYMGLLASLPAIVFFAAIGVLFSIYSRLGHILTFIIVIPLIVPAIILGAGIVYASEPVMSIIKLPIIFSLISIIVIVPAGGFLYRQLYYDY